MLDLAEAEARLLNHSFIGTEHVLLGLIHEREGLGAKVLESFDLSVAAVRQELESALHVSAELPSGPLPLTPRAKKVVARSHREALDRGHCFVGTEHLLLGLVGCEGVATRVLVRLGADPTRVRIRIDEFITGQAP